MSTRRLSRTGPRLAWRRHWPYLLLLPWLTPLLSYVLVGPAYLRHWPGLLGTSLLVGTLLGGWLWALGRAAQAVVRRFPGLRQTWPRILLNTLACLGLTALFLYLTVALFAYLQPFGTSESVAEFFSATGLRPAARAWLAARAGGVLGPGAVQALTYGADVAVVALLVLTHEAVYLLGQWRTSKISYEQRRQAYLQSQLQSLKNQINPHFLFNTLNSLSSLIADEPRQAEKFVDEIAKVYRYLLQTNEQELTTLATELEFIHSYYHLLRTRHGSGLHLRVQVPEAYRAHLLPPLTLQMLVENAVKHNVIQTRRPLHLTIDVTPAGQLRVRNNLQRKTTRVESNHVGLSNIVARYELLAQARPRVEDGPADFTVWLPLLKPHE